MLNILTSELVSFFVNYQKKANKMENTILKDFFCGLCKLQFGNRVVYDMHQSLVHKKAQDIKEEPLISDEENIILRDLFCELCKLQFDKKVVYDMHQSVVHGKSLKIKEEQSDYADKNVSEKGHHGMTKYLIDSGKKFSVKTDLTKHIASVRRLKNHSSVPFVITIVHKMVT